MKKKGKRGLSLLLSLLLVLSLAACGQKDSATTAAETTETTTSTATTQAAATKAETTAEATTEAATQAAAYPLTLTDMTGREVTIEKADRIAICWYMANDFVLALGAGDRLACIGPYNDFQTLVAPGLTELDTVGRGRPDMEKLAALNPDLFIQTASDKENLQACDELGIPAIGIRAETAEETMDVLRLVGKALGLEERAEMLCDYYEEIMSIAADKLKDVKEEEMPTFVLLGSDMGSVGTADMMQAQMIEAGGGVNAARDITSEELWPVVGTEQIFQWDPDYIFLSDTAEYTVEDLVNDPAWADLKAVKEGKVYEVPSKLHAWESLGLSPCLGTVWSLLKMHPDLYTEEELDEVVTDFYKTVYNLEVDRDMLGY